MRAKNVKARFKTVLAVCRNFLRHEVTICFLCMQGICNAPRPVLIVLACLYVCLTVRQNCLTVLNCLVLLLVVLNPSMQIQFQVMLSDAHHKDMLQCSWACSASTGTGAAAGGTRCGWEKVCSPTRQHQQTAVSGGGKAAGSSYTAG